MGGASCKCDGESGVDGLVQAVPVGSAPSADEPGGRKDGARPGLLAMTFRLQDSLKVVHFTRIPLGMSFDSGRVPMVVQDAFEGGEARKLGVKQGMVIVKIGETDVTGMTYDVAFRLMKEKVQFMPSG
mmetsp:Transcript_30750/g.88198  ORF Transcript_30750/g.88198 Transcript_30750/m.88198 type:complete len:128 (-) Transcript_30750:206-589(-)